MSYLIILRHLRVEHANAVAGLTYGFPAISHFLGYTHALSRQLKASHNLTLNGCGVICHSSQIHAYSSGYDYYFALTRNPLTKEGKTSAFNEEGRMHMTVSLVLECHGDITDGDMGRVALQEHLHQLCQIHKLAGGYITGLQTITINNYPYDSGEETHKVLRGLLPGYALLDRTPWLAEHLHTLQQQDPAADMLDAWLDFAALQYQAEATATPHWHYQPKPQPGWLVPLMVGYQRISPLYSPDEVLNSRDPTMPFCFTEPAYGVGEWRGVHRITDIETLLWRYQHDDTGYYCRAASAQSEEIYELNDDD